MPLLLILSIVGLYVSTRASTADKEEKEQAVERALRLDPQMKQKAEKQTPAKQPAPAQSAGTTGEDDPLAELMQARREATRRQTASAPAAQAQPEADDDDAVDLASLLATMGDDSTETVYTISGDEYTVQLHNDGKTTATDELAILLDPRDDRLIVQVGDRAYRTLVNAPDAKQQFTQTMKELSRSILTADDTPPQTDAAGTPYTFGGEPVTVRLNTGETIDAAPRLLVLRDTADGRLLVLIGSNAYRSLVDAPRAKQGFKRMMQQLSQSVLEPDTSPPPAPDEKESTSSPADKPASIDAAAGEIRPVVKSAKKEEEGTDAIPGLLPDFTLDPDDKMYERGRFGRLKVKKAEKEEIPEINIAEAIGKYLDYKLEQTQKFQDREIYIKPSYTGGVKIFVDNNTYDFVDEVEDDEIRTFLQETIQEWQDHN